MTQLPDVDATVQQIEDLLDRLGQTDPAARTLAEDLVRNLMQLYGSGLGQMLEILRQEAPPDVALRLANNRLVGSLLLLHGLHPTDPQTRVTQALRRVERRLDRQHLVLEEISDGIARVRVEQDGAGSPPPGLAAAIEQAVAESAPDLDGVEIEGLPAPESALVQILPAAS